MWLFMYETLFLAGPQMHSHASSRVTISDRLETYVLEVSSYEAQS